MPPTVKNASAPETGANLANWRRLPQSHWAFGHVPQIVPSVAVANDPQRIAALERTPSPLRRLLLHPLVLRATATDAVVVLVDGWLAFEWYRHGNDEHTPHILMSATKAVVGLIAGSLERSGAIHTDAPVSSYLPELAPTAYARVTLRQLLDMRADIAFDDSDERAYAHATGWDPPPPDAKPLGLHAFFANLTQAAGSAPVHGGVFRYVSANTDLLGLALERATGKTFASLVSELLWKPMGAEHEAYVTVDGDGTPRCAGGLGVTARDFARLGQLLVDDGRRGRSAVLPRALVDDLEAGGDRAAWRDGQWGTAFRSIGKTMSYRSGWYTLDDEPKLLFAMGIHGQNLFVDRANRIVVAKLSSWPKPIVNAAVWFTHLTARKLQKSLRRG
jgi:CubicO group peptidase (beta-lactamase class C family)